MAAVFTNPTAGSATASFSKPTAAKADPCADKQAACPACGGLQCLCRPRFFPGQLLTEDDLNRLSRYVTEKNKLHNRYLEGWGVACGLEVVCDPCGSASVVVRAGYALSPCGDDIVVSQDQSVALCELIKACTTVSEPVCDPPYQQAARECQVDKTEQWVLAVCYDETPMRGVTALAGGTDTGCACGGTGNCACGGASASSGSGNCGCAGASSGTVNKTARPQCEPTQICEGFRFVAYKAPKPARQLLGGVEDYAQAKVTSSLTGMTQDLFYARLYANRARFGPLLERVMCCVLRAMELFTPVFESQTLEENIKAADVYSEYAEALLEFAKEFSVHNCAFLSKIREAYDDAHSVKMVLRQGNVTNLDSIREHIKQGFVVLEGFWLDIVTECFCAALLPSCPQAPSQNCVPLAVVTVRNGATCQILKICNWQERKLLINWQTVMYWLSWLPWQCLREWVAKICCKPDRQDQIYILVLVVVATLAKLMPCGSYAYFLAWAKKEGFGPQSAMTSEEKAASESVLGSGGLVNDLLARFEDLSLANSKTAPGWASLAARLIDGSALAPLAGSRAVERADLDALSSQLGVAELRAQVEELRGIVGQQQEIISALRIVSGAGKS